MSRTKKEDLFEEDIETEAIDEKIDNQLLNVIQHTEVSKKIYAMPKLDKIRCALSEMLGGGNEVIINQVELRKELKISLPTWLKHKKTLEKEFDFIRQRRGTILRRKTLD